MTSPSEPDTAVLSNEENPTNKRRVLIGLAMIGFFAMMVALMYFSPLETGGDWNVINRALRGWLTEGNELIAVYPVAGGAAIARYLYSPFATVLLLPIGVLPVRLGWSIMVIGNNVILLLLCRKFEINIWKTALLMLSPAALYAIMFGQVDIFFLVLILLPESLWGLVALTKPQLLLGMGLEAFRSKRLFITTLIVVLVAGGISLLFFGNWPAKIAELSPPLANTHHNVARFFWPYSIPFGIGFLALGFWKKDRLLYLLGSPLLSFYAHTGSLIGMALALAKHLKTWQFVLAWALWWGLLFI